MAVQSYERAPNGGFIARYDTGLIEVYDAAGNLVSQQYEGVSGVPMPTGLPYGLAPLSAPQEAPQAPQMPVMPLQAPMPVAPSRSVAAPAGGATPDFTVYDAAPDPRMYGGGQGNPFLASSADTGGFGYAPPPRNFGGGAAFAPDARMLGQGIRGRVGAPMPRLLGRHDGVDRREQMNVPGGAKAGPFEISAAPNPSNKSYGGNAIADNKGGNTHPLYDQMRAKGQAMAGKLRSKAQAVGTGGGGSSSSYGGNTAAYRRQQREYRQQQRAYADGSYIYDQYKMRGFSKHMDPQQAEGLYYRPSMLLPKVAKGLDPISPRYDQIASLPAAQLSMLAYGHKGKAKEGPSQYVNNLAKFYRDVANRGDLPEYDAMLRRLGGAKGKSPLGAQFKNQPLGFAADTYESFVNALVGSQGFDPTVAAAKSKLASRYIDQYGSKFLKKPAKKAPMINRWVGRKMAGEF